MESEIATNRIRNTEMRGALTSTLRNAAQLRVTCPVE